jgi:hypothetical protein
MDRIPAVVRWPCRGVRTARVPRVRRVWTSRAAGARPEVSGVWRKAKSKYERASDDGVMR